jgi:hypothetical protein
MSEFFASVFQPVFSKASPIANLRIRGNAYPTYPFYCGMLERTIGAKGQKLLI